MSVTLEVSKLSGWLKAAATCRVQWGAPDRGERVAWRGDVAHRGNGESAAQRTRRARVAQLGGVGRRRRRKRTWNMRFMSMTLEVSKLSGWLKAAARCRVQRGHPTEGNAWRGDVAHRGNGESATQRTRRARVAQLGSEGRRRRWKRTWNIRFMYVTLEVSKLSGWLKAVAYCRAQCIRQREARGTEMWHTEGGKSRSARDVSVWPSWGGWAGGAGRSAP